MIPLSSLKDMLTADARVQEYGEAAIQRAKTTIAKENVFSRLIDEGEKENGLSAFDIGFEAAGFIVAGSGTTAVTLTYLVWAVLNDAEIQTQLEAEVATLQPGFHDDQLESLPYLNAVIDETLRLYGAAPGSLPRQPPKGGAFMGEYFVPEGTTVSSQAYTLHRDPVMYPQPETWVSWIASQYLPCSRVDTNP
jgi:cytochrome P450